MKKKSHQRTSQGKAKPRRFFGATELVLLAAVTIALLAFFGWQTGTLPGFLR